MKNELKFFWFTKSYSVTAMLTELNLYKFDSLLDKCGSDFQRQIHACGNMALYNILYVCTWCDWCFYFFAFYFFYCFCVAVVLWARAWNKDGLMIEKPQTLLCTAYTFFSKNTYCIKLYCEFNCHFSSFSSPILLPQRKSLSMFALPTEQSFPHLLNVFLFLM